MVVDPWNRGSALAFLDRLTDLWPDLEAIYRLMPWKPEEVSSLEPIHPRLLQLNEGSYPFTQIQSAYEISFFSIIGRDPSDDSGVSSEGHL